MEAFEEPLLHQLSYACSEAKQTFAQYIGMSQARWLLLLFLSRRGESSHAALQQHLLLDGATITRLVKQFEAEGMVSRRFDPQDNRYTLVSLTPSGQQIATGISATHSVFQERLLEGITKEEQDVMVRALVRLRTNIRGIQDEAQERA
jgi:DNA-binding MarR family transcriptional regulator